MQIKVFNLVPNVYSIVKGNKMYTNRSCFILIRIVGFPHKFKTNSCTVLALLQDSL